MDIIKHNDQCVNIVVTRSEVESAIRDLILKTKPDYSEDWILNPSYNIADVLFSGTKK